MFFHFVTAPFLCNKLCLVTERDDFKLDFAHLLQFFQYIFNKPAMEVTRKSLNRTRIVHIAFWTGSKEKVDVLTARMKSDNYGVVSSPRTTGDGYYESCVVGWCKIIAGKF